MKINNNVADSMGPWFVLKSAFVLCSGETVSWYQAMMIYSETRKLLLCVYVIFPRFIVRTYFLDILSILQETAWNFFIPNI